MVVPDPYSTPGDVRPPNRELKLYFRGYEGACNWEIRYWKYVTQGEGTLEFTVDSWLLFSPEKWEALPTTAGFHHIDMNDPNNYVFFVELYHEYNDYSFGAEVYPVGCEWDVQTACLSMFNRELGFAYPQYGVGYSSWWGCFPEYDALDARIWYYAGQTSCEYDAGSTCDPLDEYWAQTITWMAAARLEKPLCSCTNVQTVVAALQRDTARDTDRGGNGAQDYGLVGNPFGTRVGELKAWQRAMNVENGQVMSAGVF